MGSPADAPAFLPHA
jgi:hypothetical protein